MNDVVNAAASRSPNRPCFRCAPVRTDGHDRRPTSLLPSRLVNLLDRLEAPVWLCVGQQVVYRNPLARASLSASGPKRGLLTMMFTDIVGSTPLAEKLGDQRWRGLLDNYQSIIRGQLRAYEGREVDTAGDGFFAAFDMPAQAARCAWAIRDNSRDLGIDLRSGLHTGECEIVGSRLVGVAVHMTAAIAANASPGEILVSSTVRELAAGSGLQFDNERWLNLKGLTESRHLFSLSGLAR